MQFASRAAGSGAKGERKPDYHISLAGPCSHEMANAIAQATVLTLVQNDQQFDDGN